MCVITITLQEEVIIGTISKLATIASAYQKYVNSRYISCENYKHLQLMQEEGDLQQQIIVATRWSRALHQITFKFNVSATQPISQHTKQYNMHSMLLKLSTIKHTIIDTTSSLTSSYPSERISLLNCGTLALYHLLTVSFLAFILIIKLVWRRLYEAMDQTSQKSSSNSVMTWWHVLLKFAKTIS